VLRGVPASGGHENQSAWDWHKNEQNRAGPSGSGYLRKSPVIGEARSHENFSGAEWLVSLSGKGVPSFDRQRHTAR
jgi:hypothetical protein